MVQCCNGKLEIVQCFSNPSFEIESKLIFKESGPLILTPKNNSIDQNGITHIYKSRH